MLKKIFKNQAGLSMPEVMIAFFIVSMGLLGVASLIISSIQASRVNKNNMVAAGLAQEGLELVRNVRDSNWLAGLSDWKYDLLNDYYRYYRVDYQGDFTSITSIEEGRLYIDDQGFFTTVSSGNSATPFYRMVEISGEEENSLKVTSQVEWLSESGTHSYEAGTVLYNWR